MTSSGSRAGSKSTTSSHFAGIFSTEKTGRQRAPGSVLALPQRHEDRGGRWSGLTRVC